MDNITKDDVRRWFLEVANEYFQKPKPKERLTICEAVEFLTECGYVTTKSKLHKLSASGGMPRDIVNGKISFLRGELKDWADRQIKKDTSLSDAAFLLVKSARRKEGKNA